MPLENAQYISELNPAWPLGSDGVNTSDDHHRNTKRATQQSLPNISGPVTATQDDLNTLTGAATVGGPINPVGTVLQGAWAVAPNGYLPCDGGVIDPTYTDLITLVGANTPDLRGYFIRGWSEDNSRDPDGPRAALTGQDQEFLSHVHAESVRKPSGAGIADGTSGTSTGTAVNTAAAGGAETRPVNVALMFVIKW